jgi:hypothetical protein
MQLATNQLQWKLIHTFTQQQGQVRVLVLLLGSQVSIQVGA